ncbi:hypothetical protein GJT81_01505 [Enterobacteriaceae endosymbiont of Plateumaris consimilis]|uniref:YggT family protein n=1 Tax=Enterobacteriaceae endosymbiont of Plateumaris consimilis TaxID=2675794 RepID=UPI0014495967|nr:YggT family protein [Enterobacteriaceae endosymbiont of Plateumaris consimilis]QJC28691.1 hypothetical protein GJT81_01505 [Enterobacteriaceae endosymbiont of Plateumaris consimilis]
MLTLMFLAKSVCEITTIVLLLRIWITLVTNNTYNSFSQFITIISQPIIKPIQQYIPDVKKFELSSFIILSIICIIKYPLLSYFKSDSTPCTSFIMYIIIGLFSLIKSCGYLIFWLVTIRSIFSWFNRNYNDFDLILNILTDQILEPVKKFVPPIYNIDISPFIISVILYLLNFLGQDVFHVFWSTI